MNERTYQSQLVSRLRHRFPGCHIMRPDPTLQQGMPDILILFNGGWAMLEVKMDPNSPKQPNQEHYVKHFDAMSFAAFIYPGNEEEVLDALQSAFGIEGASRVP